MNTTIISGRNVRDVEVRAVGEHKVAKFCVAVWRAGDKQDDGTYKDGFVEVEVWDKTAERVEKDLKKGGQVTVLGALRHHTYEVDGNKRSQLYIVGNTVELPFTAKAEGGEAAAEAPAVKDEDNPWE